MASPSPDEIAELRQSIDALAEHMQLVWKVLDDIRQDVQWAVQNDKGITININVVANAAPSETIAREAQEQQQSPQLGPKGRLF